LLIIIKNFLGTCPVLNLRQPFFQHDKKYFWKEL
jgi:hypothetical protein